MPDFPQTAPAPAPEAAPPAPAAPAPTTPTPAAPAPLVQAASVWTEPTTPVDTARGFITTQIGGPQVLDAVDQAVAAAAPTFDAINAAITAAFGPVVPA